MLIYDMSFNLKSGVNWGKLAIKLWVVMFPFLIKSLTCKDWECVFLSLIDKFASQFQKFILIYWNFLPEQTLLANLPVKDKKTRSQSSHSTFLTETDSYNCSFEFSVSFVFFPVAHISLWFHYSIPFFFLLLVFNVLGPFVLCS